MTNTTLVPDTETTLLIGNRRHLLRPDLSGTTVCGRYNAHTIDPATAARSAMADDKPLCGVCTWSVGRNDRPDPAAVG